MTPLVLELNDAAVTLSGEDGVLASSPAYALALDETVEFGEDAAAKSRLYPLNCHNAFWHRLSMEPLTRPLAHFRHTADVAHAHLLHLAEQADAEGDLIVAVPGNFTRERLSLLLGVLEHSPFNAVGLTDTAVAAAVDRVADERAVYIDLGLHQLLLTEIRSDGRLLHRGQALPLPDLGWDSLANALMQLITDAFIRQCRFNPQHSAAWEQHLYNHLPQWLLQGTGEDNFRLEIRTDSAVHEAKLTRSSIRERLEPLYASIVSNLRAMEGAEPERVLVSGRSARLPGLVSRLADSGRGADWLAAAPVESAELARQCLAVSDRLLSKDRSVHFITVLPLRSGQSESSGTQTRESTESDARATHILSGDRAHPLVAELPLVRAGDGLGPAGSEAAGAAEQIVGRIVARDGQWLLRSEQIPLTVNGQPVSTEHELQLGDHIALPGAQSGLRLIKVQHGES